MARPSPRTQGCAEYDENGKCIKPFQKFGTQQLKFVSGDPPVIATSYHGVKQVDTGKGTIFKTGISGIGLSTVFSERFQSGITGATPTALREEALIRQQEKLDEMGLADLTFPDLADLFGGGAIDKHGCECEACKDGTGQCSDKNPKCNAWDLGCEVSEGITDIITDPIGSWWDKYGNWVYLILGVIGLGVLLWLLRPLFSMIGAFKGGAV